MRFNSKKAAIILALALFHFLASWALVVTISSGGWGTGWKEFDTGEPAGTLERICEKALMGSMYALQFPLQTQKGSDIVIKAYRTNKLVLHMLGIIHSILWVITAYGIVIVIRWTWKKRRVAV